MKVTIPGYNPTTGESAETTIELDPTTDPEKQTDDEIEFTKNQNRIMSSWNEIVQ